MIEEIKPLAKPKRRYIPRIALYLATTSLLTLAWVYTSHLTVNAYQQGSLWFQASVAEAKQGLADWMDIRPLEVLVQPESVDVEKLIHIISLEEGVSPHITLAMAYQESGKGFRTDRVRFEPHLMKRFKDRMEPWMLNDVERQMVASSHGLLQVVYGWHKKTCGLDSYTQLYQPSINIRCGLRVFKDALNRVPKSKNKLFRLREALAAYNAGPNPSQQGYDYADTVLKKYVELVIQDSGEAI